MDYPLTGFHFLVTFMGVEGQTANDISFQEVSGLTFELETEEVKEGGENRFSHKLPMPAKYSNLVLKRGTMRHTGLLKWFKDAVQNFQFKPVTVNVALLNENHSPVMNWNFVNAYPVKWSVSDLDAGKNEVMIDTLELSYQYFSQSIQ
jgi:phage tail-like protein